MTASKSPSCSWVTQPLLLSFGFGTISVGRPLSSICSPPRQERGESTGLWGLTCSVGLGAVRGPADTTGTCGECLQRWSPIGRYHSLSPVMPISEVRDCNSVLSPTSSTWVCLGSSQPVCSSLGFQIVVTVPRLLLSRGFLWWLVASRLGCLWGRKPLPHPTLLLALVKVVFCRLWAKGVRGSLQQRSLGSLTSPGFSLVSLSCVVLAPPEYLPSSLPQSSAWGLPLKSEPQHLAPTCCGGCTNRCPTGECWSALISVVNSLHFLFHALAATLPTSEVQKDPSVPSVRGFPSVQKLPLSHLLP